MTHNDLLEAVNSPTFINSRTQETPYIALRAVLELHKPWIMETGEEGEEVVGCSCIPQLPAFLNPYPCATVQAIENELK
jgi:hypothetical protein